MNDYFFVPRDSVFKRFLLIVILIGFFAQNSQAQKSSKSPEFDKFLSGIQHVTVYSTPELQNYLLREPQLSGFYTGALAFLRSLGLSVSLSTAENTTNFSSYCDQAFVTIELGESSGMILTKYNLVFVDCNGGFWTLKTNDRLRINGRSDDYKNALQNAYGKNRLPYNINNRLKLKGEGQKTPWTSSNFNTYFSGNNPMIFEGIYETFNSIDGTEYKFGVKKDNGTYKLIYLKGASNYNDWIEGEEKAILRETSNRNIFIAKYFMADKTTNDNVRVIFDDELLTLIFSGNEKSIYIRTSPNNTENQSLSSSGTGFALSENGYIVTNSHVINSNTNIKIRGVNGDFSRSYKAKLVLEDKSNDLAILKIIDNQFTSLGKIPYTINPKTSDVGNSIFVLGYPLRATMGEEVKLTNGIISSRSGFGGDITSYQISAPVQPGNSGGPLFDNSGNIIGIVNAKHAGAEGASYAIKVSYLINLIEAMDESINLNKANTISSKALSEQVKLVKNFVYIIETD